MPLYEYLCNDCHRKFDTLVNHRDLASAVRCRRCDGPNVRRLVSGFAMVGGFDDEFVARQSSGTDGGCCGGSCGCNH